MDQSYVGLNSRSLIFAGAVAGVILGLLSGIPVLSCVNCLLLAWVWGGGILAVRLYRGREGQPFLNTTQGLVLGGLAGIVGAVVSGLLSIAFSGMTAAFTEMVTQSAGEAGRAIPGFLISGGFSVLGILFRIVLYAIVGAVGGLIATAVIWKAPAAVPPPPAQPPYTPPSSGTGL